MSTETLTPDIGWEPSGHLSEVALSAAADGEDTLLDAEMHAHLDACDACMTALGTVAMRAAMVTETFAEAKVRSTEQLVSARNPSPLPAAPIIRFPSEPARSSAPISRQRRKMPVATLVTALAVAVLGAAPSMLVVPARAKELWSVAQEMVPMFVRLLPKAAARAWSGPVGSFVGVSWVLAAALVAIGLVIAKQASKKAIWDGGRR